MTKFELLKKYVKKNASKFKEFTGEGCYGYEYNDLRLHYYGLPDNGIEYWVNIRGIDVDIFSDIQIQELLGYMWAAKIRKNKREKKQESKKVEDFFTEIRRKL